VIAWLVPARLNHPGMYEVEEGEVMEIATLEGHRHYADTPSGPVSYLDIGEATSPSSFTVSSPTVCCGAASYPR
jgi:hypothetical protein